MTVVETPDEVPCRACGRTAVPHGNGDTWPATNYLCECGAGGHIAHDGGGRYGPVFEGTSLTYRGESA